MTWLELPISPGTLVTVLTVVVVLLSMLKAWLTAQQRLLWVYWIMIVAPLLHFGTTVIVAVRNPELAGVLVYGLLSAFTVLMGIVGLVRMRRAAREVRSNVAALKSRSRRS